MKFPSLSAQLSLAIATAFASLAMRAAPAGAQHPDTGIPRCEFQVFTVWLNS